MSKGISKIAKYTEGKGVFALIFILICMVFITGPALSQEIVPLKLYWSSQRGDNFTTATARGEQDAKAAGYPFIRVEGYIYSKQQSGTVPLKLYWSSQRGDNFVTATSQGEKDAISAKYQFIRTEGYVYSKKQPGTVPLKLYWSSQRGDNFTTATAQGEQDAKAAGYSFVRVAGYVIPACR